jgi:hypothetical protein
MDIVQIWTNGNPGFRSKGGVEENHQVHNLKVTGSNAVPATSHQAIENASFSMVLLSDAWLEISFVEATWKRREESRSVKSAELGVTQ